jgi:hypothetical protein
MKEKQVNRFFAATPDSENSKYKHLIFFELKNIVLTGYSGKVGMKEKDNDIDNFVNYVLRLMKNNYYPGGSREIELHLPLYSDHLKETIFNQIMAVDLLECGQLFH